MAQFDFEARVFHWRGPSPYFFVAVPPRHVDDLRLAAKLVTYGWGMIPVAARICDAAFNTSLWPKDGTYVLPLKDAVRHQTNITAGDVVAVQMDVRPPRRPRL